MGASPCSDLTDEQIMARLADDRSVFSCLIARYEAPLTRYVRRIMPGIGDDVSDVLQEIFLKVYVNARGFDTALSFSSWVYRIAHNEAVSWLRRKKARPESVELGDDDCNTFVASMEQDSDRAQRVLTKDAVGRVLAQLDDKYRTVLILQYLEGKSYAEISDILSIPPGTVATLVHRAKKKFSSIYAHHHGEAN